MIKKFLTALATGVLAFGFAATSQFSAAPVSAEAYTYEPITGINVNNQNYHGAIEYVFIEPISDVRPEFYTGSIPHITGLGYTASLTTNPKNGASGNPVISDASFPGPGSYEDDPIPEAFTFSTIDTSNVTFTRPGEYVWTLTPNEISYPAGVTSKNYDPGLELHVIVIDNNGELETTAAYINGAGYINPSIITKTSGPMFEYSTHSLDVSKQVTGTVGDKSKKFSFTVNLTGCNPGTVIDGTTVANDGTWSKIYQITHDDHFTIDGIPDGAGYTITETNADDYTTSFAASSGSGSGSGNTSYNGYDRFWAGGEGNNLLRKVSVESFDPYTMNGVTFNSVFSIIGQGTNMNGAVEISGTATDEAVSTSSWRVTPSALAPGTYTVSAYDARMKMRVLDYDNNPVMDDVIIEAGSSYTFTLNGMAKVEVMAVVRPSDGNMDGVIAKAAIVKGETPLASWEPYSNPDPNRPPK